MRPDDLSNALSPKRFRPFVLNLSNGESYRITHPEQVLVDRSVAMIGTKRLDGGRRDAGRYPRRGCAGAKNVRRKRTDSGTTV